MNEETVFLLHFFQNVRVKVVSKPGETRKLLIYLNPGGGIAGYSTPSSLHIADDIISVLMGYFFLRHEELH